MKHTLTLAFAAALSVAAWSPMSPAQNRGGPAAAPGPAPRWPDGRINLGAVPGENGVWEVTPTAVPLARADSASDFGLFSADMREPTDPFLASRPKLSQVPFQPWARALFDDRVQHRREPYTRCKPSPGGRQVATAYGTQFLEVPELKRLFIFETGGAHSYRTIFMDGRPHPADLSPTYRGHSVGRWDGDTLIVDTVGYNEGAWIDNLGMPTTDKLHTIESFTRTDSAQIRYEITVDDPGAYTATWKSGFYMRWVPGAESFEFICQDNNQASDLMVGDGTMKAEVPSFVP